MSWKIYCVVLIVMSVTHVALIFAQDDKNFYSKRYDSIDVDTIFRSSRLLNNYVDCLLDKKPCPPEGKDLKRVLPQVLRSKCSRCTKIQKAKALDVVTRLYYQYPSIYLSLAERYDPKGEYTRNFEQWYENEYQNKPNSQIQYNEVLQKTRIPSTWITKPTTTSKTISTTTSSRPTLRTRPPTVRFRILPTESPSVIPIVRTTSERPITTSRTTTSTERSTSTRLTTSSTVQVEQFPVPTTQAPIIQQFNPPANQQFVPQDNPQFTPESQQVPQTFNLPQPINPQFVNQQQLPVTENIPSTFTTTSEVPSIILTNPATSSFRPIQQSPIDSLSDTGISSVSAISTSGSSSAVPSSQTPLSISSVPAIQVQVTSFSSDPVQQVPSSFNNNQPSLLTSSTFGTPLVQNFNANAPRQPASQIDPNFIDNFFVPRRGLIRRSVDQILNTTRDVMRAIFRIY